MNTERRHELETNTLAKGLNAWSDKLRPYTSAILALIAGGLALYIVASLWNSYQASRDRAAWDDYQLAVFEGDAEQRALQRLADSEDHAGSEMQEWALMAWADRQLLRASQLYLTNRDEAKERLTEIAGTYEQLAETGANQELRNRARLGLARVSEMQNDLDEARAQYALVKGALAEIAAERIKQLESKEVQETYKWLATVDLPKRAPPTGPGTPGQRPGLEAALPPTDGTSATPAPFDLRRPLEEVLGGLGEDAAGAGGTPATEAAPSEEADATPEEGAEGASSPPTATEPPPADSAAPAPQ